MTKKVVLITGCSTGIGRAMALEFQKAGCTVIGTSRTPSAIDDLQALGIKTFRLNVNDEAECRAVVASALATENRIDILVNNAGYGIFAPVIDLPENELLDQIGTNVLGPLRMIRYVAPAMREAGSGVIVNVGSVSGITPTPFAGGYCASKSALHALSDALRMELAPFGIRVVIVQPGAIASEFGRTGVKNATRLLRSDSWYLPAREAIRTRAEISQVGATPAQPFAAKVVARVLRSHPPARIRGGKHSFLLPLMKGGLPTRMLDAILSKKFGLATLSSPDAP